MFIKQPLYYFVDGACGERQTRNANVYRGEVCFTEKICCCSVQEAKRAFEQGMGRLRAELAGDKEAALSALKRESDEDLQVTWAAGFRCTAWAYRVSLFVAGA